MSKQNKAATKAQIKNPQSMPRKHTKQYWRTSNGTMIARKDCNSVTERAR